MPGIPLKGPKPSWLVCIIVSHCCWLSIIKVLIIYRMCSVGDIGSGEWWRIWRRQNETWKYQKWNGVGVVSYVCTFFSVYIVNIVAFSAFVWHWEEHPPCKNWVMGCWCGYLSGARCRLLTVGLMLNLGPADATAIPKPHYLLPHLNPDWFYLSGTSLLKLSCPGKEAVEQV